MFFMLLFVLGEIRKYLTCPLFYCHRYIFEGKYTFECIVVLVVKNNIKLVLWDFCLFLENTGLLRFCSHSRLPTERTVFHSFSMIEFKSIFTWAMCQACLYLRGKKTNLRCFQLLCLHTTFYINHISLHTFVIYCPTENSNLI